MRVFRYFSIACLVIAFLPFQTQEDVAIVATVDDQRISLNQVQYQLDKSFEHVPELASRKNRDKATLDAGIQQCVDREIALNYLQTTRFKTTDVESQLDLVRQQLAQSDQTLDDFLAQLQLSEAEYRRELQWKSSWSRYTRHYITQKHLEKRFEDRRRFYDGTELHVAQILWKSSDAKTMEVATNVMSKLKDGSLSWDDAVAKYSQSASAKFKGDLGWIGFQGPMARKFTDVAFALNPGDFSSPFKSQFGVHLIRCIEIRDGEKKLQDVIERIRDDETKRLFDATVAKHRDKVRVEIK
jgi:parvulin-like peptidyl-prolyl isomerase